MFARIRIRNLFGVISKEFLQDTARTIRNNFSWALAKHDASVCLICFVLSCSLNSVPLWSISYYVHCVTFGYVDLEKFEM